MSEHTSDILKLVVKGLISKIENAAEVLVKHSNTLAEEIADAKLEEEVELSSAKTGYSSL